MRYFIILRQSIMLFSNCIYCAIVTIFVSLALCLLWDNLQMVATAKISFRWLSPPPSLFHCANCIYIVRAASVNSLLGAQLPFRTWTKMHAYKINNNNILYYGWNVHKLCHFGVYNKVVCNWLSAACALASRSSHSLFSQPRIVACNANNFWYIRCVYYFYSLSLSLWLSGRCLWLPSSSPWNW